MPEQDPAATTTLIGQVDAVHGPVVDICTRYLPPLNQALMVRDHREPVLLEVFQHLNPSRIRAIALHSTAGLARGMPVFDTGAPLHVPVAPDCLGRMLNVFGEPLDKMPAFASSCYRRSQGL